VLSSSTLNDQSLHDVSTFTFWRLCFSVTYAILKSAHVKLAGKGFTEGLPEATLCVDS
jgi:hypothetical protein